MSGAHVRLRTADRVATVVFDNPPLHVWNAAMTRGLAEALDTVEDDPSVGVVVLTGAGDRAFCAGSDIVEFAPMRAPGEAVTKNSVHSRRCSRGWRPSRSRRSPR